MTDLYIPPSCRPDRRGLPQATRRPSTPSPAASPTRLQNEGLIHLYGSGHSVLPCQEAFPRYGTYVGFNPLTDPRVMWHNVLGPGGVRELLWLERTEKYAEKFLDHQPLNPGDCMIVFGHSGRNASGIDAALYAKKRGIYRRRRHQHQQPRQAGHPLLRQAPRRRRRHRHRHLRADRGRDRADRGLEPSGVGFIDGARHDPDARADRPDGRGSFPGAASSCRSSPRRPSPASRSTTPT